MSFFNFKAFSRNLKKNKNGNQTGHNSYAVHNGNGTDMNGNGSSTHVMAPPSFPAANSPIYSSPQNSTSKVSLRRPQSPARQQQHYQQQHYSISPQHTAQHITSTPISEPRIETQQIMFLSEPFVRTALVKGSFKTIVQLPKYVDLGEWVALNVFEFFSNLNTFYGVIAEYLTPDAYPTMNAGPRTDYLWLDANNRQVSLSAGQYIDLALTWINNKVNDTVLFPTKSGVPFPQHFYRDVTRIMIQMFRIFAHIYHHHFDKIVHLSLEAHWNSFFTHFINFAKEFQILDRNELYPLLSLIESLERQGKII